MSAWNYSEVSPFAYGDETTYRLGMEALADCAMVEDWGCGTAWAKRFREGPYLGIDQAPGYADVVCDLQTYRSTAEGVFVRHVLEHNHGWHQVLENAVASATRRLVVVIFTPFSEETHVWTTGAGDVPDYSFNAADIESAFGTFTFTDHVTETQYGAERLYVADA